MPPRGRGARGRRGRGDCRGRGVLVGWGRDRDPAPPAAPLAPHPPPAGDAGVLEDRVQEAVLSSLFASRPPEPSADPPVRVAAQVVLAPAKAKPRSWTARREEALSLLRDFKGRLVSDFDGSEQDAHERFAAAARSVAPEESQQGAEQEDDREVSMAAEQVRDEERPSRAIEGAIMELPPPQPPQAGSRDDAPQGAIVELPLVAEETGAGPPRLLQCMAEREVKRGKCLVELCRFAASEVSETIARDDKAESVLDKFFDEAGDFRTARRVDSKLSSSLRVSRWKVMVTRLLFFAGGLLVPKD